MKIQILKAQLALINALCGGRLRDYRLALRDLAVLGYQKAHFLGAKEVS